MPVLDFPRAIFHTDAVATPYFPSSRQDASHSNRRHIGDARVGGASGPLTIQIG
jgi:hypothetical protein